MEFRTEYRALPSGMVLNPEKPLLLVGSCFADNMSERMRNCLWQAVNPLGTLYNPLSIAAALRLTVTDDDSLARFRQSLFEYGAKYHSRFFDSRISSSTEQECVDKFLRIREEVRNILNVADTVIVTLGTSWCYFPADDAGNVVANCHKLPADRFVRRRIGIGEICGCWRDLTDSLKRKYPQLRIIFTVSPVRHVKDGLIENMRSKAILLLAVEKLCAEYDFCHYFPAYEIVNDDLRDYRFYAADLVHPSDMAVEYIWEKFRAVYLDAAGEELLREGEKLRKRLDHRLLISTPGERNLRRVENRERLEAFLRLHPLMYRPHID